jgi:histidine triad (HIT) family protein
MTCARTRLGGAIVRFTFAHASSLLPVTRLYEDGHVIAFRHPEPVRSGHVLIVPKRAIAGLDRLTEGDWGLLVAVLRAAAAVSAQLGIPRYEIVVNAGAYQDVRQLHFHVLPLTGGDGQT